MTPRVMIADPTAFVRLAARAALLRDGIVVVAEVSGAAEATQRLAHASVDVVLLDAALDPAMQAVARIREADPDVAVIVLAPDDSDAIALAAVRAGACGVIPKDTPAERLAAIVRGAVDGEAAIPRRVVRRLLDELCEDARRRASGTSEGLSSREQDVMSLLSDGLPDPSIADHLGISATTVRRHVGTAMQKFGTRRRADAVARYRQAGRNATRAA